MLVLDALIELDEDRAWITGRITRITQNERVLTGKEYFMYCGRIAWTGGDSSDEVGQAGSKTRSDAHYTRFYVS